MNFSQYTLLLKLNSNIFYSSTLQTCRDNNDKRENFEEHSTLYKKKNIQSFVFFLNNVVSKM